MNADNPQITFLEECRELLVEMEEALLSLENNPSDADMINAVFRAIHTIKGSGGVFGFDDVVDFTHVVENVLDKVRSGDIAATSDLISDLLLSRDHVTLLVEEAVGVGKELNDKERQQGSEILDRMRVLLNQGSAPKTASAPTGAEQPATPIPEKAADGVVSGNWHISLRFGLDVLRNGMDPMAFVSYLKNYGDIVFIKTLIHAIPPAKEMDPESCYLGFEIDLKSDTGRETIENVFEFVREDCAIRILAPHCSLDEYKKLIEGLGEGEVTLGEMLIKGGALTRDELGQILHTQPEDDDVEEFDDEHQLEGALAEESSADSNTANVASSKTEATRGRKAAEHKTIRVDAEKLDILINLVGEMVIAGAGTRLLAHRTGETALVESMSMMSRLVEEIRDSTLRLRMVQISGTFNRFNRVVRDISRGLGKEVKLEISGGETELDKTVVEKIGDPLMHLVRNALDHGIETADERIAQGKPASGCLKLNAYHDSGSIVIEISDDGRGLDRDKILAKAVERGIVEPDQAVTDQEICRYIFEAGFSTAAEVTNVSGRGVGMDVVKENIEALRGTVDVRTQPGQGTTMIIRLPLTLAIIDGFLVGVGGTSYIIPLDMVVECLELKELEDQDLVQGSYINLRGEALPYLRLGEVFGERGDGHTRENVVIVRVGEVKAGLVVDELLGEFQTVIKPLGKIFQHLRSISGSTILGSGEVAVILDVPGLVEQAAAGGFKQTRVGHSTKRGPESSTTIH